MQAEEFLNILKENIVYEVLKDNQVIEKLIYLFKNTVRPPYNHLISFAKIGDYIEA